MNFTSAKIFVSVSLGLFVATAFSPAATPSSDRHEAKVVGSIRPEGKIKSVDLPALTRITFEDALKNALRAAPGNVIKAELEIEDGTLMYSFEIVGADKKITEVEVDAGNGKVLGVDRS